MCKQNIVLISGFEWPCQSAHLYHAYLFSISFRLYSVGIIDSQLLQWFLRQFHKSWHLLCSAMHPLPSICIYKKGVWTTTTQTVNTSRLNNNNMNCRYLEIKESGLGKQVVVTENGSALWWNVGGSQQVSLNTVRNTTAVLHMCGPTEPWNHPKESSYLQVLRFLVRDNVCQKLDEKDKASLTAGTALGWVSKHTLEINISFHSSEKIKVSAVKENALRIFHSLLLHVLCSFRVRRQQYRTKGIESALSNKFPCQYNLFEDSAFV